MIENIRMRKSDNDQIIIDFLRGNPISYKDLLEQAKKWEKNGVMAYPTFRRRYLKLIGRGWILKPLVQLAETIEGADPQEVNNCIEIIAKSNDSLVILERMKQLRQLSASRRIAHLSGVLNSINQFLSKTMIIKNNEIWGELMSVLSNILRFEQGSRLSISLAIIKEITNSMLSKICEIIKEKNTFIDNYTIYYLEKTGKKEAVDVIFKKIIEFPDIALSKIKQENVISSALGRSCLYDKNEKHINLYLDDFLKDDVLREISIELRQKILWTTHARARPRKEAIKK